MTADTSTPIYGFLLQGTGNNPNSWGANLNDDAIVPIENALAGVNTISGLTGGAYALLQVDAVFNTIILNGTLVSDLTITAPSQPGKWTFINNLTMAGFYVLIKTAAGTSVNIPGGVNLDITCDGTNMYRADRDKVGEYFYHAGTAVPAGALECNGATPLRLSAVDLFAKIGTTHGVGNGTTTFTLPDGYTLGKFLRSRTAVVTAGTAQTNQNKAHTHTGSGSTSTVGTDHTHGVSGATGTESATHTHAYNNSNVPSSGVTGGGSFGLPMNDSGGTTGPQSANHTHSFSVVSGTMNSNTSHLHTYSFTTSSDGGTEARPENISAILCIRY